MYRTIFLITAILFNIYPLYFQNNIYSQHRVYMHPDSTGNGSSWENATNDIQYAIDSLNNIGGGEVWMAKGTYFPTSTNGMPNMHENRHVRMYNNIRIIGGFSESATHNIDDRNPGHYKTIISGNIDTGNGFVKVNHVVYNPQGLNGSDFESETILDSTAVMDGIYITQGHARKDEDKNGGLLFTLGGRFINCNFSNGQSEEKGNIYLPETENGYPEFIDCNFSQGYAVFGAAIYSENPNVVIEGSEFNSNRALISGGALYIINGGVIKDCNFKFNQVSNSTDINNGGGAIFCNNVQVEGCSFESNSASDSYGGAVYAGNMAKLISCLFIKNEALKGGGVYSNSGNMVNCIVAENKSENGGGVYNANLLNCTVALNEANISGGGVVAINKKLFNTVIWRNSIAAYNPECVQMEIIGNKGQIKNCAVQDYNFTVPSYDNNIILDNEATGNDVNKNYCGLSTVDFNIESPHSDLIDAGISELVEEFEFDYDGDIRIYYDHNVDIGAQEYQSFPYKDTLQITVNCGKHGKVEPLTTKAPYEELYYFHIYPEENYTIATAIFNRKDVSSIIYPNNGHLLYIHRLKQDAEFDLTFEPVKYPITIQPVTNGEIITDDYIAHYDSVEVIFKPDEGYHLSDAVVDGVSVMYAIVLEDGKYKYKLKGVNSSVDISANFEINQYTITTESDYGTVTPSNAVVNHGNSQSFKLSYSFRYTGVKAWYNGVDVTDELDKKSSYSTYDAENVNEDGYLKVELIPKKYKLNYDIIGDCSVTGPENDSLRYNVDEYIYITPGEGSIINMVSKTGDNPELISVDENNVHKYKFKGYGNTTIKVRLSKLTFEITTSCSSGGNIYPYNKNVIYGEDHTVRISPHNEYDIDSVLYNKVDITSQLAQSGSEYTYTINNVVAGGNIRAVFKKKSYTVSIISIGNGSVETDNDTIESGNRLYLSITCPVNDYIKMAKINGISFSDDIRHTTGDYYYYIRNDIDENQDVEIEFVPFYYQLNYGVTGGKFEEGQKDSVTFYDEEVLKLSTTRDKYLKELRVNNEVIADSDIESSDTTYSYTLKQVDQNTNIDALFEIKSYPVTINKSGNGEVFADSHVFYGDDLIFYFNFDNVTEINSCIINGVEVDRSEIIFNNNSYTYTCQNVKKAVTIDVVFLDKTFQASFNKYGDGNYLSELPKTITNSESITVEFTPSEGSRLDSVKLNGVVIQNDINESDGIYSYILFGIDSDIDFDIYFSPLTFNLKTVVDSSAKIYPQDTIVKFGESVEFIITPKNYYTDPVALYSGVDVSDSLRSVGNYYVYTIENIHANGNFNVEFSPMLFSVDLNINGNAVVEGIPTGKVSYYDENEITITPESGYNISQINIGGLDIKDDLKKVGSSFIYLLKNVKEDIIINMLLEKESEYNVSSSVNNGGRVQQDKNIVGSGGEVRFSIYPNEHYTIESVEYDGENVMSALTDIESGFEYVRRNIVADGKLIVVFKLIEYNIEVNTNGSGSVTGAVNKTVTFNDNIKLIITPDVGYKVSSITKNGENITNLIVEEEGELFVNLAEFSKDTDIEVIFEAVEYKVNIVYNDGGNVTKSDGNVMTIEDEFDIEIEASQGYFVAKFIVNGTDILDQLTSMDGVFTYKLNNISSDMNIEVVFDVVALLFKNKSSDLKLTVFPNPATDLIQIREVTDNMLSAKIYTLEGKIVKDIYDLSGGDISVSDLNTGTYVIVCIGEEKRYVTKFIKK